jgi:hypothetical protein
MCHDASQRKGQSHFHQHTQQHKKTPVKQPSAATEHQPNTKHGINDDKTQALAKIHTFKTFGGLTVMVLKN